MKKFWITFVGLLVLWYPLTAENLNKTNRLLQNYDTVFRQLWEASDPFAKLISTDEGDMYIDYKLALQDKEMLKSAVRRASRRMRKPQLAHRKYEYCHERLMNSLSAGFDQDSITEYNALMYINALHKDSVNMKASILADVLFPIYYNKNNLTDTYFIYKLIDFWAKKYPQNSFLAEVSSRCMSNYKVLKEYVEKYDSDNLEGLWISINDTAEERTRNGLPALMLDITKVGNSYLACLRQESSLLKRHPFKGAPCALIEFDSVAHLSFMHRVFKSGLSKEGVEFGSEMVSAVGNTAVKMVNASTNMSSFGKDMASMGIGLVADILIAAIGNASANKNTNRFLDLSFHQNNFGTLDCSCSLVEEIRISDGRPPIINKIDKETDLYRVDLDDEALFATWLYLLPIVHSSRMMQCCDECQRIFPEFRKMRRTAIGVVCAFPFIAAFPITMPLSGSIVKKYNTEQYQKLQTQWLSQFK